MSQVSQQDRQELALYQQIAQNLDVIKQQRINMDAELSSTNYAVKELEKAGEDAVVYKSISGLFIQKSQTDLLGDSKNQIETLELRIKSIKRQEDRMQKQFDEKKTLIDKIMKKTGMK